MVITTTLAAIYANPGTALYSAAKAGLVMFVKVPAKELAPQSIRVNTIHPTTVATDMILNEATYGLFRPDLENPTRADFAEAALTLNALPVPALGAPDRRVSATPAARPPVGHDQLHPIVRSVSHRRRPPTMPVGDVARGLQDSPLELVQVSRDGSARPTRIPTRPGSRWPARTACRCVRPDGGRHRA